MARSVPERYFNNDRHEMLRFVPVSARYVLELGCASGTFAALVKERQQAEIWGVELDSEAAARAAERMDRVLHGDVREAMAQVPDGRFDCIVCNDVLEHLPDPEAVLRSAAAKLSPGGVIVASIPNLRYLPVLYELLVRKDFRYRDWGVLDRTHLRFFTRRSIRHLFESAGFELQVCDGIQMPQVTWLYKAAFLLVEVLTLGYYNDCRYIQFGCVARHGRAAG